MEIPYIFSFGTVYFTCDPATQIRSLEVNLRSLEANCGNFESLDIVESTVWYSILGIIERKHFYYIMIRSCPGHINSNIDQLILLICPKSNSNSKKLPQWDF